ncbi:hypothetical protein BDR26DRAFT_872008, partial [Obelidium mucronatum]
MEASPETSRTATSSAIISEDASSGPNVGLIVGCVIGVLLAIVFLVLFWNLKKSGKLTTVGSWLPKPKRRESDMDVVEKGVATRAIAGETGAAAASAASSPKVTLDFLDQLNRVDTVDRPNSEGTSNKSYATDSVDRAPLNATTTPSMISWVPSDSSNPVPPSMVRQDALPSQTPVYMQSHENHISEQYRQSSRLRQLDLHLSFIRYPQLHKIKIPVQLQFVMQSLCQHPHLQLQIR